MKNTQSRGSALNYVLFAIVASMVVLAGCQREEQERAPVVRPVRILTIGGGGEGATLSYSGEIRAGETAELGFEVPGRIIELPVVEGQSVTQGELLARLDPADFQAQLGSHISQMSHYTMQIDVAAGKQLAERHTLWWRIRM